MHLILNQADWEELLQQAPQTHPHNLVFDDFETIQGVPEHLGRGYDCEVELLPGVWLGFTDWEIHQDWIYKEPAHDHLIQIMVCLSGFLHSDIYPTFGGTCGYFSGSGVAPANAGTYRVGQRLTIVNVEIEPQLLEAFLTDEQRRSDTLKLLFKEDEWKVSFYPTVTLLPPQRSQGLRARFDAGESNRMATAESTELSLLCVW